jgi:hypothetical protein
MSPDPVAAGVVYAYPLTITPLLDGHSKQDDCSFGEVSNARYRELLAKAEHLQRTKWKPLTFQTESEQQWTGNRPDPRNVRLAERFRDMTEGMATVQERLAAMHAMMRAMGAIYVDPFRLPSSTYQRVSPFSFSIDAELAVKAGRRSQFNYTNFEWSNSNLLLCNSGCSSDYFISFHLVSEGPQTANSGSVSERLTR